MKKILIVFLLVTLCLCSCKSKGEKKLDQLFESNYIKANGVVSFNDEKETKYLFTYEKGQDGVLYVFSPIDGLLSSSHALFIAEDAVYAGIVEGSGKYTNFDFKSSDVFKLNLAKYEIDSSVEDNKLKISYDLNKFVTKLVSTFVDENKKVEGVEEDLEMFNKVVERFGPMNDLVLEAQLVEEKITSFRVDIGQGLKLFANILAKIGVGYQDRPVYTQAMLDFEVLEQSKEKRDVKPAYVADYKEDKTVSSTLKLFGLTITGLTY